MPLATGSRLGPYEILAAIGAGGMGEVYKARDTRLNRLIAIKVLPGIASHDPERRERFEREAQAIAALNHPNIVTIYSVEYFEPTAFLTMELVERSHAGRGYSKGRSGARSPAEDRHSGRRRGRGGAPEGHHAPRSEARQHHGRRRRAGRTREGVGFWSCEAHRYLTRRG
jgi:hypothetical protein